MVPLFAFLLAFACAVASAVRVWFAGRATPLHPEVVREWLARCEDSHVDSSVVALRHVVSREPSADWERDLFEALDARPEHRVALVNEQLTELDYRLQRWIRVPRVCASISTSGGFLLATWLLRSALAATGDVPIELGEMVIRGLVGDALTVGAMGVVGTAFCIGAQSEARRIATARAASGDRLVEALEALMSSRGPILTEVASRMLAAGTSLGSAGRTEALAVERGNVGDDWMTMRSHEAAATAILRTRSDS